MRQRRTIIVSLIVVAIAIAAALLYRYSRVNTAKPTDIAPTQAPLEKVSLRLPIPVADTAFAPYYLAVDKGIFAKHGLDVTLEPGSPELNPVKMISQGTDEFAVVGGPELLLTARSKGAPVVGVALLHKDSDFVVLLTLKNSGITTPQQLAGRKVGFFYGHISTDVLRMLFHKLGISVDEVDVGFDYGQLLTGKLAAQWAFRTTAGLTLPDKGMEVNFISPAAYGIETDGHVLITSDTIVRERPELADQVVAAVLEAITYSLTHVNESIDATIRRDPKFSRDVGERQLAIYNAAIRRNEKVGWISKQDLLRAKDQMASAGLLPADFNVEPAYSDAFVRRYYDSIQH